MISRYLWSVTLFDISIYQDTKDRYALFLVILLYPDGPDVTDQRYLVIKEGYMKVRYELRDIFVGKDGKRNRNVDPVDLLILELDIDKMYYDNKYRYNKYLTNRWAK